MTSNDLSFPPFQSGWYSSGLGSYRPCHTTYCRIPYESLPLLPEALFQRTLDWLTPLGSDRDPGGMEQSHSEADLMRIVTSAQDLHLVLPQAFIRLLSSPELMKRIPSCTDCYFSLSEKILPCPGNERGYIIRFLNDSQGCLTWYLYITPQGEHSVLVSPVWLDILEEEQVTEEEATQHTYVCAASFEEFMYRFWIENRLWYSIVWNKGQKPLTAEEQRYLAHYTR
jgi:hypothetical protein